MTLQESAEKILAQDSLLTDRFYDRFFQRHPEARPFFDGVDMQAQSVMLTMTLTAISQHPNLSNASRMYLRILGTRHNRRGVPQELYVGFLDVLLSLIREFHQEDWNEPLAAAWREAFAHATEYMFEGYEDSFHA